MAQNTLARKVFLSRFPQADYDTAVAFNTVDPFNFVQLPIYKSDGMADYSLEAIDNEEVATGLDIPTDQYISKHDAKMAHKARLDAFLAGLALYGIMGSIVTTTPAAGIKRHAITPVNPESTVQLPTYTYAEKLGFHDYLYPSCVWDQLEFSGEGPKQIETSFNLIGSGKQVKPSGVVLSGAGKNVKLLPEQTFRPFTKPNSSITIADAGTLSNASTESCRLRRWQMSFNNNHNSDDGYMCNKLQDSADNSSGAVRSRNYFGKRLYQPKFLVEADAGSDYIAALKSQKAIDWKIDLIGQKIATVATVDYFFYVKLHGYLSKYSAVQVGEANNLLTYELTPKIFQDSSGNWFAAEVQNDTASYTA